MSASGWAVLDRPRSTHFYWPDQPLTFINRVTIHENWTFGGCDSGWQKSLSGALDGGHFLLPRHEVRGVPLDTMVAKGKRSVVV